MQPRSFSEVIAEAQTFPHLLATLLRAYPYFPLDKLEIHRSRLFLTIEADTSMVIQDVEKRTKVELYCRSIHVT